MKKNVSLFFLATLFSFSLQATTASFVIERNCVNEKTILQSTSNSKDIIVHQLWDLTGNHIYNDAQGVQISQQFPDTGVFNVGLMIITNVGDTVTYRKDVVIYDKPVALFSVSDRCSGDSTVFTDLSTISSGKIDNFLWLLGDGTSMFFKPGPKHRYNNAGIYDVTLITVSEFGCKDTFTKSVEVFPTPEIVFTVVKDTVFFEDDSAHISVSSDFISYLWSTGDTLPMITVKNQGVYGVSVVDVNHCPASSEIAITVIPKRKLRFVDIITPNNDGINDHFQILDMNAYKQVKLQVFNRYGIEVFQSDNYENNWDATYNGKLLPQGSYYYIVEVIDWNPDRNTVYKGSLSILY